jgi:M6 family metalloprotease-like protein
MTLFLRSLLVATALGLAGWGLVRAEPPVETKPAATEKDKLQAELADFRTVETAITARVSRSIRTGGQTPYLGFHVEADGGRLRVAAVEPGSPADKAGLKKDDVLRAIAGQKPEDAANLRELIQARSPGDTMAVIVQRKDKEETLEVTLAATSRPLTPTGTRAVMGVQTSEAADGVRVDRLTPGMPALEAGIKEGDVIVKLDSTEINGSERLSSALGSRKPGDTVTVTLKRDGKSQEIKVKLVESADGRARGWDNRITGTWHGDVYRLAVVAIDFPDVKHNDKITTKDWDNALFTKASYTDRSVTGQQVFGSLNDYYLELSCGKFHVEGKALLPVEVSKKRIDYANMNDRTALLNEALDILEKHDGKDVLKEFDGLCFVYSGARADSQRGGLYWPHRASFSHNGKRWPYFIVPEGGQRMTNISVICHEFGHMLGLPDLYAKPEVPGMEGLGVWCAMSQQLEGGRPQHFSAWCKEQLGWLKPALIDPSVKQKLILAPVESSAKECFKVLLQADGSEYLLLENRKATGFDKGLPGEGLLVWRVVDGRPLLEESHGIAGPQGPTRFLQSIPFPSASNNAFTPYTTPSSKSIKGDGYSVHITNIRRLPDGRITFWIGYEYL